MAAANLVDIVIRARDQTKAAFAGAKAGITSTKTATGGLSKNLGGLNKSFSAVSGKVSGFGTKLKGLMTSAIGPLIGVMGIAAVTMALKKSVDAFGSFEQAAANASSVTGKTGAAFLETKKHIMDVSKVLGETTVFKASEAADAFYDLASAGYDVANITKTELKPILDLAAASQTDLKATTELVTSTLGQFGMAIGDSKKVADVFARTIGSSKATMEKLGNSMVYVGPVAHALGRSLEETSATLGVLYNKGFDASMAGTALRGALSRLMNPTAQVEAKLSELGVTVAEVNPETHSMADILDTLTSAGMDTADAMELFGLRAGPAMLALTQNTDDIRELTASLGEAGGAAETMASQQLTTFEGQMKLVKSKIEAFMLNIGEMTAPAVLAMANALTDHLLPALETLYTEISTGFGEAFESIRRQVGPALAPLSEALKEVSDKMSAGLDFKTLADDVGVFVGAALNPLIQAFTWLIDKLGPLWDLIGKGSEIFHSLANALKTEAGRLDDIRDATEKVSAAKQTLFDINEKLKNATKSLADEIKDAGGWTKALSEFERAEKISADLLTDARKAATAAIAEHGASSEIARAAIEKVGIAEESAKQITEGYQAALGTASQGFIDAGVATEGLQQAHLDLETVSNDSISAQEGLQTAISDLATEIEESKQAPFNLGEAFGNFGGKVKEIFLELPLRIAEAFGKINSTVADVFSDLGTKISDFGDKVPDFLGGDFIKGVGESFNAISDNFNTTAEDIETRVKEVRDGFEENLEDPLKEGVPEAAEVAAEAVDDAMSAIVEGAENAGDGIDGLAEKTEVFGEESVIAGETAEEAYKGIELQVGDTEVSIEGLSGELGDNVNAFEDMEAAAQKLIDLDWSVFTEFEAALPNIEAGIGNMESSFVGLKDILEDNIGELENVKQSVMDISDIAAPFLEAGFLDGIKSIGSFAGSLKDAGSAINTFSSLQDVSVAGCANFSKHVYDMVSALEALDSQMEDLMPAFGDMDSLITSIVDSFIWTGGRKESIADELNRVATAQRVARQELNAGVITWEEYLARLDDTGEIMAVLKRNSSAFYDTLFDFQQRYIEGTEDVDEVTKDFLDTSGVAEKQMDKQTDALWDQTAQLNKITIALQPYLEFMRTLNELAALSTLSTAELNSGLNSINDTLVNLSKSLSTFDLRPVMESLFGTKMTEGDLVEFTGGAATGFTKVMTEYTGQFSMLISSISSLSSAILVLTSSFDALANISESILVDQTKLKKVFEDIADIMANVSLAMGTEKGEWGFAQKIADGMAAMIESAKPLIAYFQTNNAAVELFNGTLNIFSTTITNVVDSMTLLKEMSEMTLPTVDELEAGFDKAGDAIYQYQKAMLRFSGEGIASLAHNLNSIEKVWESWMAEMGTSLTTFNDTSSGISGLTNSITGLVSAFTSLAQMPIMTAAAFSAGMKDMSTNITNFAAALKDNIGTIETSLKAVDDAWSDYADSMNELLPIFKDATGAINTLAGGIMSVVRSFESLKEVKFEEVFATGFKNLTKATGEFATALKNNIDGLLTSLNALVTAWLVNEDETVRLMRAFITISSNFIIVIGYAKELQEAFSSMATGSVFAGRGFENLTKFMNKVIKGIKEIYTTESASDLAQFVIDVGLVISALSKLEETINTAMSTVRTKIDNTVNDVKSKISELANISASAYTWGEDTIYSFVNGMIAMKPVLEATLIAMAQMIAFYLGVSSNTKMGALSKLTEWPKNLVSTFAEGIRKGTPELSKALSALTLPVESLHIPGSYAGLLGGSHNTVTMYNTWNVDSQQNADYAIGAIETMLTRKKVL